MLETVAERRDVTIDSRVSRSRVAGHVAGLRGGGGIL